MADRRTRIIVAITGASGAIYGVEALRMLREIDVETHLVVSRAGAITCHHETGLGRSDLAGLADVLHRPDDIGASIASGSFRADGMIVAPCSMKTLAEIATGLTSSLISRAADVTLKERRPLILMVRETPLNLSHLENMAMVTRMGGIVSPPVPAFYAKPSSLQEMVVHTVGRSLDLFNLNTRGMRRWEGLGSKHSYEGAPALEPHAG